MDLSGKKMCCGLGKCGHCRMNDTYICLDGPVFCYSEGKNCLIREEIIMDINTKKLKKMPSVYQRFVGLRLPECVFREAAVMQMSCSRWWILPENMETDRFILPHARDLKLKESIWKIWIKLMRCSSRS